MKHRPILSSSTFNPQERSPQRPLEEFRPRAKRSLAEATFPDGIPPVGAPLRTDEPRVKHTVIVRCQYSRLIVGHFLCDDDDMVATVLALRGLAGRKLIEIDRTSFDLFLKRGA